MNRTRRELLKDSVWMGAAAFLAGCVGDGMRLCGPRGASMQGFVAPKLERVRVGVIGLGYRGGSAVRRLQVIPGVEITALCEVREECLAKSVADCASKTGRKPTTYSGEEGWKALCDSSDVDVIYNCAPWHLHAPVAVYAMEHGKHAFTEVPAAMTVEECWQLVETSERTRRHCMMLENACYDEWALLFLSLCRKGLLGELIHAEGGYLHDRRWQVFNDKQWKSWRREWNRTHGGNQYPMHGLGPIAQYLDINRGDRFDYLVSVDSHQAGYERFARETLPEGDPRRDIRFKMSDMNVTTIRTARGRTVLLEHDVSSPRPKSEMVLVSGTKGCARAFPMPGIFIEKEFPTKPYHGAYDEAVTERYRKEHMHPYWKTAGEIAAKVGGHGGCDFLMDLRWVYCLRNGLPLDMDVYDLAAWCSICELSERSVDNRAETLDVPDFTRGGWKTAVPLGLLDVDIRKAGLANGVGKVEGQFAI